MFRKILLLLLSVSTRNATVQKFVTSSSVYVFLMFYIRDSINYIVWVAFIEDVHKVDGISFIHEKMHFLDKCVSIIAN